MNAPEGNGGRGAGAFVPSADGMHWSFGGALTFDTAAAVLDAAAALPLPRSGRIDFAGLEPADSAALAVMIALKRRASHERHRLAFENVPAGVAALAHVYGIDDLLGTAHVPA